MSDRAVHTVGAVLIVGGFAIWAVTDAAAALVITLCGVALIVENWIKGGSGKGGNGK